jgi:hypothetical protein
MNADILTAILRGLRRVSGFNRRSFLLLVWGLALAGMSGAGLALAQAAVTVTLSQPEMKDFPRLSAFLDVQDADGNFVHGLHAQDVSILEDGIELPVATMDEKRPGAQFVLVIAPGPTFDIRDGNGISRYEHLLQGLVSWDWDPEQPGIDDLSLEISGGPEVLHVINPSDIIRALQAYEPLNNNPAPNLEMLSRALDVAGAPTLRPAMKRGVLFITAPQTSDVTAGLQSLASRASQQGIRVSVWLVAPSNYAGLPGTTQLQDFASQTGGRFFMFTGSETVPDLEGYIEPLRSVYRLEYDSHIATSGMHQVTAQVSLPSQEEGAVTSPSQSFEIDLQAPQPVFVSPPTQIERTYPDQGKETDEATPLAELTPAEQALEVVIEFPDGYKRDVQRTTLYVDGSIAGENTAPPLTEFTWDLRGYVENGRHVLKVEAVDSLGLSGMSADTIVQITVPRAEQNILAAFSRHKALIAGLVVLLSGSVLALVLVLGGRIRPRLPGQPREAQDGAFGSARGGKQSGKTGRSKRGGLRRRQESDPLTQPVEIAPVLPPAERRPLNEAQPADEVQPHSWRERFHLHQRVRGSVSKALAYLIPLTDVEMATLPAPLPIDAEDVTLGSDALKANVVLHDASVEGLHARLVHREDTFYLADAGSVAGTWVNYSPLGSEEVALKHGDLVHIGKVGFHFMLREPGRLRKPVVIAEEHLP